MDTIEQIKAEIARQEKALANPKLFALMGDKIQAKLDKAKADLVGLEAGAEKKIETAKEEIKEAIAEGDKKAEKEAKKDLAEAKTEAKKVEKAVEKAVAVSKKADKKKKPTIEKMEKPKGKWGGQRPNAGRGGKKKAEVKASFKSGSDNKVVKPSGVKPLSVTKVATKVKKERAFGQVIEYTNDAEFCSKLIKALKKRKSLSKKEGKRKKTKPVFGVITSSVRSAVSKALHNVSEQKIQANPKEFLAKAQRLEKSAMRFLEDFKSILGSDFKKSEITSEFGELEKMIKKFVEKVSK